MHAARILALALVVGAVGGVSRAEEEGDRPRPEELALLARHGGQVLARKGLVFEVVFTDEGVRVYPMSESGDPALAFGMKGVVWLKSRLRRSTRVELAFVPGSEAGAGHLAGFRDLSRIKDRSRTAIFELEGVPAAGGATVSFWTRFVRTTPE